MPHTNCTAFKRNGEPCNVRLTHDKREGGLCGKHNYHLLHNVPEFTTRFNREQERYRERWQRRTAMVAPLATVPVEVAAPPPPPVEPPPVRAPCGHVMTNGNACNRISAGHADGKCTMHHNMMVRQTEEAPMRNVIRLTRTILTRVNVQDHAHLIRDIDRETTRLIAAIPHLHVRRRTQEEIDRMLLAPFNREIDRMIHFQAATIERVDARIEAMVIGGFVTQRRSDILRRSADAMFRALQWRREFEANHARPRPVRFGPNQREAQLAADSQNVHTREITQQMRDSLEMLTAVDVPATQENTVNEIRLCWVAQGRSAAMIATVYNDVVDWWNRKTIFSTNDKLFKKCLRGLWWTIKQYTGETRKELEKRLWEECKEAAIPYSVCVQGHMARLSNVMVGFDEAFAPPVPVGEVLQNRMAAIAGMDLTSDEQVMLAKELLKELNIPTDQHSNWLAAF